MSPQLSLPSNPNLRQLRNQAKDLWRAFRSREPDAALRFRQSLPQLAGDLARRRLWEKYRITCSSFQRFGGDGQARVGKRGGRQS